MCVRLVSVPCHRVSEWNNPAVLVRCVWVWIHLCLPCASAFCLTLPCQATGLSLHIITSICWCKAEHGSASGCLQNRSQPQKRYYFKRPWWRQLVTTMWTVHSKFLNKQFTPLYTNCPNCCTTVYLSLVIHCSWSILDAISCSVYMSRKHLVCWQTSGI